ncbi:hypothetical protein ACFTZB_21525 [Rhodococcus sp. NPDC057014]
MPAPLTTPRAGPFSHHIIVNPNDAVVVTVNDAQQEGQLDEAASFRL